MIIESIISTVNKDGIVNFTPIGVHIDDDMYNFIQVKEIELWLYEGSQTCNNLNSISEGVVNLTDDILAFVETALFSRELPNSPSKLVFPPRMAGANTVFEFSVVNFDKELEPARVKGKIEYYEEFDGFRGFCRAQGAVLEAVIMATRLEYIQLSDFEEKWDEWEMIVSRTGGVRERQALKKIKDYIYVFSRCHNWKLWNS